MQGLANYHFPQSGDKIISASLSHQGKVIWFMRLVNVSDNEWKSNKTESQLVQA